jgi:nicotinate phosphoribosyltransferase
MNLQSVQVTVYEMNKELNIDIEGPWTTAIFFEVPLLAIVNEIYFKHQKVNKKKASDNLIKFCTEMENLKFSDFGTRRRFSKKWQEICVKHANDKGILSGTSNVFLAMKYKIKPVGTMAHEWLQIFQVLSRDIRNFQKDALNEWMLTYRGKLDTALTDIIGIDAFLKDWDSFFADNYSCLRHDSGCPFEFIQKVKEHYNDNLLFHKYPILLFSDGLTPKTCLDIKSRYPGDMIRFGIGTNFTNNVGLEPLQIVIKLNKVNGQNVIKLSDSPGKVMCEDKNLIYTLKQTFNLKGY